MSLASRLQRLEQAAATRTVPQEDAGAVPLPALDDAQFVATLAATVWALNEWDDPRWADLREWHGRLNQTRR